MPESLVEAVREFRRRTAPSSPDDTYVQKVTWDLDESDLVGERMDSRGIRLLGRFVDRKLEEYAAIHNSRAEVRAPSAHLVPLDADLDDDEHVCSDQMSDGFQRFNTSAVPKSPNFQRPNTSRSRVVRPLEEGPVVFMDDIEAMPAVVGNGGCHTRVQWPRPVGDANREEADRCVGLARQDGVRCGLVDDAAGDDLCEDDVPDATGVFIRRFRGSALETIRYNYEAEEHPPDEIAYSSGQLPGIPMENRQRDVLMRYPPQDGSAAARWIYEPVPARRSAEPPSMSYLTSYDVNHVKRTVTGRVLTVPANMHVDDMMWFDYSSVTPDPDDVREVVRRTVRANLVIRMNGRNDPARADSDREALAQETLREMVSEDNFRKYVKYGFINVRGRSGDVYQVFRDRWHTKVWRRGKLVSEVCVRLRSSKVPPTDNVIAFMSMICADEQAFLKAGNVYRMDGVA